MTDGLDQALANVGLDLLRADAQLTVFAGSVSSPTPAPPYVVVYFTVGRPSDDPDNSADGLSRVWVARWICHCVGGNDTAARAVAQRVRTALLDVRPTVAGLSCGLIRWEESQDPQRDETTGSLVMDAVEIYSLRATN